MFKSLYTSNFQQQEDEARSVTKTAFTKQNMMYFAKKKEK